MQPGLSADWFCVIKLKNELAGKRLRAGAALPDDLYRWKEIGRIAKLGVRICQDFLETTKGFTPRNTNRRLRVVWTANLAEESQAIHRLVSFSRDSTLVPEPMKQSSTRSSEDDEVLIILSIDVPRFLRVIVDSLSRLRVHWRNVVPTLTSGCPGGLIQISNETEGPF